MPPPASASPNPFLVVDSRGTTPTTFHAFDLVNPRFFIRGRIDTYSDYLVFRIATKIPSTGEASAVAAEEFFDALMAHFAGQPGGLPTAIRAIWEDTDPEFATNLTRFNAALASGDDDTTAAGRTFTGRMAAKYNYPVVVMGITDPPTGPPYSRVTVYFKK